MDGPSPGFPHRWFLPMIQLLLCILAVQPYWSTFRTQIRRDIYEWQQTLLGNEQPHPQAVILLNVTPDLPTEPAPIDIRLSAPVAANLPVGLIQAPFVLFSPTNTEWAPEGLLLAEWRALSWPFLGLVFWWAAGRGLEAFAAAAKPRRFAIIRPPLHWVEVILGLSLLVLGSTAAVMFSTGRNPFALMKDWVFAVGAGLWAALGAVIVVARLLQWRIRRIARLRGIVYVP